MEVKDLRIGNLVSISRGDVREIYSLGEHGINVYAKNQTVMCMAEYEIISPILLTEEWLKKFGFHDGMAHYYLSASSNQVRPLKLLIKISESGFYISLWDESEEIVIFEGEKYYVHQLQNLFFAHKGEELIFKN